MQEQDAELLPRLTWCVRLRHAINAHSFVFIGDPAMSVGLVHTFSQLGLGGVVQRFLELLP